MHPSFRAEAEGGAACGADLEQALAEYGFRLLGAFIPEEDDGIPALPDGGRTQAVILVGNAGPGMWAAFQRGRRDEKDPLDSWTRRVIEPLAANLGLGVVFPFAGPPWAPFQRWAERCGTMFPSPIGISIHPRYGTWFGMRAALLADALPEVPSFAEESPCAACADKPCLAACAIRAANGGEYDAGRCIDRLKTIEGHGCLKNGCQSRHACPVGQDYAYGREQAEFHMRAFVATYGPIVHGF